MNEDASDETSVAKRRTGLKALVRSRTGKVMSGTKGESVFSGRFHGHAHHGRRMELQMGRNGPWFLKQRARTREKEKIKGGRVQHLGELANGLAQAWTRKSANGLKIFDCTARTMSGKSNLLLVEQKMDGEKHARSLILEDVKAEAQDIGRVTRVLWQAGPVTIHR
ncbi:uncharacterized protein CIMG_12037 [Coccidioides immitis RS]|uniref:Uncharacterized protein n=1 Tax=Coccidioides immitis (strain RS) TaxID=246410 RepID=A0A0D8JUQ6_COCIM|nr:uncharacterized protein CIMG_12037 [Coccidioides immitis RS]KJF60874.1 hypothetical protein CIMG_12037 [Coccidioides immitis RS]